MPITAPIRRRATLGLLAGSAATLALPTLHAAAPRRVRYVLAIPTMGLPTANQTSIPRLLGYYEQEGISLEPVLSGAGGISAAVQLVATGDQDIGSGSLTPMMERAAQGQDLGLSFFYNQIRAYHMVIGVPPDSPVKTVQDLKGKLIGVPTLANEGVVVTRFVARDAGMNVDTDVRLIAVGAGAQAAQAVRSNQVAAYVATRGQLAQIERLGISFRPLPLPSKLGELFSAGLFARRDFLQKNRSVAVGVGRAVAKSTLFLLNNPEAAVKLHWKAYPEQVPQGVAPEKALQDALQVLKVQMDVLRFQDHETTRRLGAYRPESVNTLFDVFGWAGKVGSPEQYFSNALVEEINAFDSAKVIEQARNYRVA